MMKLQVINPLQIIPNWKTASLWHRIGWGLLGLLTTWYSVFFLVIFINHVNSPEITRGVMFEVVTRLMKGLPIYPAPTTEFVPHVYLPFFPFLSAGFSHLFGLNSSTLRFVPILATIGSWILIYDIVRRETGFVGFGLVSAGLFAASYRAFDGYMDYANPDSWMLFTAILGLYLLQYAPRNRRWTVIGTLVLCASFWFKQHGAFLAIAGLGYITWRDGLRRSFPYWVLAGLLVPISYVLIGPRLFGDQFLYLTYQVPSAWSVFNKDTIVRLLFYIRLNWAILAGASLLAGGYALWHRQFNIWFFALPFALASGFLGALDSGSENNVFITMGTWFIIVGAVSLGRFYGTAQKHDQNLGYEKPNRPISTNGWLKARSALSLISFAISFILMLSNPINVFTPPSAWKDYSNLVDYIRSLDGIVYMPDLGQLPSDIRLPYVASWVQLEDLVRGPGRTTSDNPKIMSILQPLTNPSGKIYIITDRPLEGDSLLGFLSHNYKMIVDLGDKYKSLHAMPGRFSGHSWPSYVYVYSDVPGDFRFGPVQQF